MSISSRLKNSRKFWLNLHLYAGLIIGFFFVILGLTGSANVFYYELEEFDLPNVSVQSTVPMVKLETITQTLKAQYPQKTGKWTLLLPGEDSDYILASYPKPPETADEFFAPFRVLFHPYTGEIVREYYWGQTVWSLVYELHTDLMTGKLGAKIGKLFFQTICFLAVPIFIMLLTGLYLWFPKWQKIKPALTIKRGASIERLYFDVHKVAGVYSAVILLILTVTGFAFAHADYLKPVIGIFSQLKPEHLKEPKPKSIELAQPPIGVDAALTLADTVFPNAILRGITLPEGKSGVYVVQKRQTDEANHHYGRSKVWIDQYSGKILMVQDPAQFTAGESLLNIMRALHSGEAFGFGGRLLWCMTGFVPLLLYSTGMMRWLQKRKVKQLKKAALGR